MSAVSSTPENEEKSLTILVTGYGPFINSKDNPSSAIAFSLTGKTHVFFTSDDDGGRRRYKLTFQPHPEAVKVAYAAVDALVPRVWEDGFDRGRWDYVLHIGVGLQGPYSVETRACELGYVLKDVDGLIPGPPVGGTPDEARERTEAPKEGSGRLLGTPEGVAETVVALVAGRVKDDDGQLVQIHSSTDAGMYLCEYIFRTSLMEAEKRGKTGRVLFLHVPPEGEPYNIETGVEVVKAVVEGMVVSEELTGPDGC